MNILKLEHAALLVQDVEQSRRFYCEVLGMQEIPSGGNCFLRKGDAEVHLLAASQGQVVALDYRADDLADGYITHVAFEVDDLEEAQQHLKNSNIPIVCGPRPQFDGKEQLSCMSNSALSGILFLPAKTEKLLARDVEQEQAGIFLVSVQSLPQNCVLLLPHILLIDLTCRSVLLQSFVCIFAQIEHVCYKEVLYARPQTQY